MRPICVELTKALSKPPFFDVSGGCGIDMSAGESPCMEGSGIWFKYSPFCGCRITRTKTDNGSWTWHEEDR